MSGEFVIVTVTLTTLGVLFMKHLNCVGKKIFISISFWSVFCVYDILFLMHVQQMYMY